MRKIYLSSIAISASLFNSCGTANTNSNISEESLKYINNNLNNIEKAETWTELETIAKNFKTIFKTSDRNESDFEVNIDKIDEFINNIHLESVLIKKKELLKDLFYKISQKNLEIKDFDASKNIIPYKLLLENRSITILLSENEGKHIVVGPLYSCITIVAFDRQKSLVINDSRNYPHITLQNHKLIEETFKNDFELFIYYNHESNDDKLAKWVEEFTKRYDKQKIRIECNPLKCIERDVLENLYSVNLDNLSNFETEVEKITTKTNAEDDSRFFLVAYIEDKKLCFARTSMMKNNYLKLEFTDDKVSNFLKIQEYYHKLYEISNSNILKDFFKKL